MKRVLAPARFANVTGFTDKRLVMGPTGARVTACGGGLRFRLGSVDQQRAFRVVEVVCLDCDPLEPRLKISLYG